MGNNKQNINDKNRTSAQVTAAPKHAKAAHVHAQHKASTLAIFNRQHLACKILCVVLSLLLAFLLIPTGAAKYLATADFSALADSLTAQTSTEAETTSTDTAATETTAQSSTETQQSSSANSTTDNSSAADQSSSADNTQSEEAAVENTDTTENQLDSTEGDELQLEDSLDAVTLFSTDDNSESNDSGTGYVTSGTLVWDKSWETTTLPIQSSSMSSAKFTRTYTDRPASFIFWGETSTSNKTTLGPDDGYYTKFVTVKSSNSYSYAYDNYIEITPNDDLVSLTLNLSFYSPKNSSSYVNGVALINSSNGKPYFSTQKNATQGYIQNASSSTEYHITFEPEGGLSSGTTYYLAPFCCLYNDGSLKSFSSYADYAGIKLVSMYGQGDGTTLSGDITNAKAGDEIKLTYSADGLTDITSTVEAGEDGTATYELSGIPLNTANGKLTAEINGVTKEYTIKTEEGAVTQPVDASELYSKVTGTIQNNSGAKRTFTVQFTDGNSTQVEVAAGASGTFELPYLSITNDKERLITVSADDVCDVSKYISSIGTTSPTTLDCGTFTFSGSDKTVSVKNCDDVTFSYAVPIVGSESTKTVALDTAEEYKVPASTVMSFAQTYTARRIYSYTESEGTVTYNAQVTSPFTVTDDMSIEQILPTYTWTSNTDQTEWTCVATYTIPDVGSTTGSTLRTTTLTDITDIDIVTRATATTKGTKKVTATFTDSTDVLYFDNTTHEFEYESTDHYHDGITFKEWTESSLPTSNPSEEGYGGYYLTQDYTLSENLTLSSKLDLCLNGHVINCSKSASKNYYITISNTVNFYNDETDSSTVHYFDSDFVLQSSDSQPSGGYTVYGGCIVGMGRTTSQSSTAGKGAIYVSSGKTFNSYGVNYVGNNATSTNTKDGNTGTTISQGETGAAIWYKGSSTSTIKGGTFLGNTANYRAGAVAVWDGSTITFDGVKFYNNWSLDSGGGALFVYQKSSTTSGIIQNCDFQNNYSRQNGGAIFFSTTTTSLIKDTNISNNFIGLEPDGSTYSGTAWGGGCVSNNSCSITMEGKVTIRNNYNWSSTANTAASKKGGGNSDNFCVECDCSTALKSINPLTVSSSALGKVHLTGQLSEGSEVGFNIYNWNSSVGAAYVGRVTTSDDGVNTKDSSSIWSNPNSQYFTKDNILPSSEWAMLRFKQNTTVSSKSYTANGDLYIVNHTHEFTYSAEKSDSSYAENDELKTACGYTNTAWACTYNDDEPLYNKLAFDEESSTISCDGNAHTASLSNADILTEQTLSKFVITNSDGSTTETTDASKAIVYQKWIVDTTRADLGYWEDIKGAPTEGGATYRAKLEIQGYNYSSSAGDYQPADNADITIYSPTLTIKSKTISVSVTLKNKTFDDSVNVPVNSDTIQSIQVSGAGSDKVEVVSFTATTTAANKYVGDNRPLNGFDASTVKLKVNDEESDAYTLGTVTGTVNIVAADQNPKAAGVMFSDDIRLVNLRSKLSNYASGTDSSGAAYTTKFKYAWDSSFDSYTNLYYDSDLTTAYDGAFTDQPVYSTADDYGTTCYVAWDAIELNSDTSNEYNASTTPISMAFEGNGGNQLTYEVDGPGTVDGYPQDKSETNPYEPVYGNSTSFPAQFGIGYDSTKGYYYAVYADAGPSWVPSTDHSKGYYHLYYDYAHPNAATTTDSYELEKWEVISTDESDDTISNTYTFTKSQIDTAMAAGSAIYGYANKTDVEYTSNTSAYNTNVTFKAYFKAVDRTGLSVTLEPNIDTSKTVNTGDLLKYKATITNTGNVTLTGIKLQDVLCGYGADSKYSVVDSLAAGASATIDISTDKPGILSYNVTETDIRAGKVSNTAYASATYDGSTIESSAATVEHTTADIYIGNDDDSDDKPYALQATLTPNPDSSRQVGDTLTYTIVVTNNSNVSLEDISIVGANGSIYSTKYVGDYAINGVEGSENYWAPLTKIEPGKNSTKANGDNIVTATYTVDANDISSDGYLWNNMTVSAKIKKSDGTLVTTLSKPISAKNQITNKTATLPTAKTGLVYTGGIQDGFSSTGEGVDITTNATGTDAGTYTSTIKLKKYYTWPSTVTDATSDSTTISWTIAKKALTITDISDSKTYDGKVLETPVSGSISGFVTVDGNAEGLDSSSKISTKSANVGTYTELGKTNADDNTLVASLVPNSFTKLDNYSFDWGTGTSSKVKLQITELSLNSDDISVSAADLTYNGKAQAADVTVTFGSKTLSVYDSTKETGDYTLSGDTSVTDAKVDPEYYTVTVTAATGSNFTGSKSAKFQVKKKAVTINVTGASAEKSYTGTEQSISGYTVSSTEGFTTDVPFVAGSLTPASADCTIKGEDAGTYYLNYKDSQSKDVKLEQSSFSYDNDNLDATISYSGGVLKINAITITSKDQIKVDTVSDQTYCGKDITVNPKVYLKQSDGSYVELDSSQYTLDGNKEKNANTGTQTYSINITFTGNMSGELTGVQTWKILPYAITISSTGTYEKTYDATIGDGASFNTDGLEGDVITTTIKPSSANAGEYTPTSTTKKLETSSDKGNDATTLSNYKITYSDDLKYTINQRSIYVVADGDEQTFKNGAYTLSTIHVRSSSTSTTDDGLLSGHSTSDIVWCDKDGTAVASPSATNAGSTEFNVKSLKIMSGTGTSAVDVTSNYDITYGGNATLKINPATVALKVTGTNYNDKTYTGAEQSFGGTSGGTYTVEFDKTNTTSGADSWFDPTSDLTPAKTAVYVKGTDVLKSGYALKTTGSDGKEKTLSADDFVCTNSNFKLYNNTVTFTQGYLNITKKAVTIKVSDAKTGDGNKWKRYVASTDTITGLVGSEKLDYTNSYFQTNDSVAGTYNTEGKASTNYTASIKFDSTTGAKESNYDVSYDVSLTISDKLQITVTANSNTDEIIYDGKSHTVSGYTVTSTDASRFKPTYFKLKDATKTPTTVTGTNAGTYNLNLDASYFEYDDPDMTTDDYAINYVDGGLTIKPLQITTDMVRVNGSATAYSTTYNGQNQTANYTLVFSDGTAIPTSEYTVDGTVGCNAGTYSTTITGQHNLTGTLEATSGDIMKWKISPASATINIAGTTDERTYNGQEQTLFGYTATCESSFVDCTKVTPAQSAVTVAGTNAGTYYATMTNDTFSYGDASNVNVTFNVTSKTSLTIKPVDVSTLDVSLDQDEFTYDKNPHKPNITIKDGTTDISIDNFDVTGYEQKTDAGTYTITLTPKSGTNYTGTITLTWKINKAKLSIGISGQTLTKDYDGTAYSVSGIKAPTTTGTEATVTGAIAVYNQNSINPNQTLAASRTNAGITYMNMDITKFTYDDANVEATFSYIADGCVTINAIDISSAASRITAGATPTTFTYNGNLQGPTFTGSDSVTSKSLALNTDYLLEGNQAVNANADGQHYTMKITGTGNYTGTLTYNWVINKVDMKVSITGNHNTCEYDGDVHRVVGYTATEVATTTGGTVTGLFDAASVSPLSSNVSVSQIEVGKANMELETSDFSYADTSNFNVSFVIAADGYSEVTKKDLSGYTAAASSTVYNGSQQSTTVTVHKGTSVLTQGTDFIVSGQTSGTDVGEYAVTITGTGNYTGSISDVKWNITKATINVNVVGNNATFTFDGTEHSTSGYKFSSDNTSLFSSDKVSYTGGEAKAASGTLVGTYATTLTADMFSYSDTTNVTTNFTVTQGTLSIEKANLTIAFNDSKAADGTALTYTLQDGDVTGLVGGDKFSAGTFTTNSALVSQYSKEGTAADCYTANLTFVAGVTGSTLATSYNLTYNGVLSITSADANTIVVVGKSQALTYDGAYHTLEGWDATASFTFDPDKVQLKSASTAAGKAAKVQEKDVKYSTDGSTVASYGYGLTADDFEYIDTSVSVKFKYIDASLTINPKLLTQSMLQSYYTDLTYNGETQHPSFSLIDGESADKSIITSDDFTVNNPDPSKNVGSYTSSITGKGNYTGTLSGLTWKINKATLNVTVTSSKQYDNSFFEFDSTTANEGDYSIDGLQEADNGSLYIKVKSKGVTPGVYYEESDNTSTGYYSSIGLTGDSNNNYNIVKSIKLTIKKKDLEVAPADHTYTYDKSEHKLLDSEITYDSLVTGQTVASVTWDDNNKLVNVGEKTGVKVVAVKINSSEGTDVTGYYNITYKSATLKVNKANMTIKVTGNNSVVTYDGQGHSLPVNVSDRGFDAYEVASTTGGTITGLFDISKLSTTTPCRVNETEIGEYPLGLTSDKLVYADDNVSPTFDVTDGKLTIQNASFSSCQFYANNYVYDGTVKNAELSVVNGSNTLVENTDYTIDTTSTVSETDAGTYTINITGIGNYAGSTKTITWTISRANMTLSIKGVNKTVEYTGSAVTFPSTGEKSYTVTEATATGLYDSNKLSGPDARAVTRTDLGTSVLSLETKDFSYDNDNINTNFVIENQASLTITQASIASFKASATALTYNATNQTAKITVKSTDGSVTLTEGIDYTVSGTTSAINAGTYYAKITGIGNYTGTIYPVTWTINKADMTIAVFGRSKTTTYTGATQSLSGFTAKATSDAGNLFAEANVQLAAGVSDTVSGVNAKSSAYTVSLTAADFVYADQNVNATFVKGASTSSDTNKSNGLFGFIASLSNGTAWADDAIMENSLTIDPATITINANDVKAKDGTVLVHKVLDDEVTGVVANQVLTGTIKTNSAETGEYKLTDLDCTFSVDGTTIATNANADSNYTISNASTLTITDDNVIEIAGTTTSVDYDGQAHSIADVPYTVASSVSNFDSSKLHITCTKTSAQNKTAAGTYALDSSTFYATYDDTTVKVTIKSYPQLVINKKSLTSDDVSAVCSASYKYDGSSHIPTASDVTVKDGTTTLGSSDYTLTFPTTSTNPGTYTVTVTATTDGNYKDSTTCTYVIQKAFRLIKVTGNSVSTAYDGASHSASGYETAEYDSRTSTTALTTTLVDTSKISPASSTFSVSRKEVGTTAMGINIADFAYSGTNKDYVDVEFQLVSDGYVKISEGEITSVTFVSGTDNLTYNGNYQSPTIDKVKSDSIELSTDDYTVSGNSAINAGTYTLTITGKNSYAGKTFTATWQIAKAVANVAIKGTQKTVAYSGVEESAVGYTATVTGAQASLIDTNAITPASNTCVAKQTEPGTASMNLSSKTWAYSDITNFNVSFTVEEDGFVKVEEHKMSTLTYTYDSLSFVYNATVQKPDIALYNGDNVVDSNKYTTKIVGADGTTEVTDPIDAGTYYTVFTAKSDSYYTGELKVPWKIDVAEITLQIVGATTTVTYNQAEHSSTFTPSTTNVKEKTNTGLLDLTSFNVTISDSTKATIKQTNVGSVATSFAAGDFTYDRDDTGNTKTTFEIVSQEQIVVTAKSILASTVTITVESPYYKGENVPQSPTVKLVDSENKTTGEEYTLKEGTDYELDYVTQTTPGSSDYSLSIRGIGNYKDTDATHTWNVQKPTFHISITGNNGTKTYNGTEQAVYGYSVNVKSWEGANSKYDFNESLLALKNNPYTDGKGARAKATNVAYDSDGTVTVAGYMGLGTAASPNLYYQDDNYNVVIDSITDGYIIIEPVDFDDLEPNLDPGNTLEYNGKAQCPDVKFTVKDSDGEKHEISIADLTYTAEKHTDVNDAASPYTISVTAKQKGNVEYGSGTYSVNWWITPRTVYLGTAAKPFASSITPGGTVSFAASDWYYKDGTAGMCGSDTITGDIKISSEATTNGTYRFTDTDNKLTAENLTYNPTSAEKNYTLVYSNVQMTVGLLNIASSDFTITCTESVEYNGSEYEIGTTTGTSVVVKYTNPTTKEVTTLTKDTDYTVTSDKQTHAWVSGDKYKVTIEGVETSNYTGSVEKEWIITPKACTIKNSTTNPFTQTYDGTAPSFDLDASNFDGLVSADQGNITSEGKEYPKFTGTISTGNTTNSSGGSDVGTYKAATTENTDFVCTVDVTTLDADKDKTRYYYASDYTFTYSATISVTKKTITVVPDELELTYNGKVQTVEWDTTKSYVDGIVDGQGIKGVLVTSSAELNTYTYGADTNKLTVQTDPSAVDTKTTKLSNYDVKYEKTVEDSETNAIKYASVKIIAATIDSATLSIDLTDVVYDGKSHQADTSKFTVTDTALGTLATTDYAVETNPSATDAGTYTVKIKGAGHTTTSKDTYVEKSWTISPREVMVKVTGEQTYNGKVFEKSYDNTMIYDYSTGSQGSPLSTVIDNPSANANLTGTIATSVNGTAGDGTGVGTYKTTNTGSFCLYQKVAPSVKTTNDTTTTKLSNYKFTIGDSKNVRYVDCELKIKEAGYDSDSWTITPGDAIEYDGQAHYPNVTIKDSNDNTLTKDKDYTLSGSVTDVSSSSSSTITFTGNYNGSKSYSWSLTPRKIALSVSYDNYTYDREKKTYNYTQDDFKYVDSTGAVTTTAGLVKVNSVQQKASGTLTTTDAAAGKYTYSNSTSTKVTDGGTTFDSKTAAKSSNYELVKDKYSVSLTIKAYTLNITSVVLSGVDNVYYDGATHEPGLTSVTDSKLGTLQTGEYTFSYDKNAEDAGTYKAYISGTGSTSTTSAYEKEWKILPREVIIETTDSKDYDGAALSSTFKYEAGKTFYDYTNNKKGNALSSVINSAATKANMQGTIATSKDGVSANGVNAGTYTYGASANSVIQTAGISVVTGSESTTKLTNYNFKTNGKVRYTTDTKLTINQRTMTEDEKTGISISRTDSDPEYDGNTHNPTVTLTDNGTKPTANTLVSGTDYTISDPVTDAGEHELVITGSGNYKGTIKYKWNITPRKIALVYSGNAPYADEAVSVDYTSANFKHVSDGAVDTKTAVVGTQSISGTLTTSGKDCATYYYPERAGEGKLTVGKPTYSDGAKAGNYELVTSLYDAQVTITPASIAKAAITLGDLVVYDPENPVEQTQGVESVVLAGKTLTDTTCYTVAGNKGTEPGVYTLTVNGVNNYCDQCTIKWVILGPTDDDVKKIGDVDVDVVSDDTSPSGTIDTSKSDLIEEVSDANEMSKVADGAKLRIWLSITNVTDTIGDERPEAKSALDDAVAEEGADIATYNDVSLFKQLSTETLPTQITETKNPIDISLVIPGALRPDSTIASRIFGLTRYHEDEYGAGETTKMDTEYDQAAFKLDFASDKFSDYALTKVDTLVPQPEPQPTPTPDGDGAATDSTSKTGDAAWPFAVLAAVALAGGVAVATRRRKQQ